MKILFLTNNLRVSNSLYHWLVANGENIQHYHHPINADFIIGNDIEFVISYNYSHIVRRDVIELLPHRIINLHISLLPYNRGADPNIWSFIERTPIGVTIHEIDEGLDTGDVLLQHSTYFDIREETLRSSYDKLHRLIQVLFRDNWDTLKHLKAIPKKQNVGGTVHYKDDSKYFSHILDYDDTVFDFLKKVEFLTHKE